MLAALRGTDASLADVDSHGMHLEAEVVGTLLGREDIGKLFEAGLAGNLHRVSPCRIFSS